MAGLKHSFTWLLSLRLALFDIITICACGVISTGLHGYSVFQSHIGPWDALFVISSSLLCIDIIGGYEIRRDMCTLRYASEHLLAMCAVLVISFITTYSLSSYNDAIKPGRTVLLLTIILATPVSLTYRYCFSHGAARAAATHFFYVLGTQELASDLLDICLKANFRYPLRYIAEQVESSTDINAFALYNSKLSDLLRELLSQEQGLCEGIIVDLKARKISPELLKLLLDVNLHSVPVYPVESFIESFFYKIDLSHVNVSWAFDGTFKAYHHKSYGRVKSLVDVMIASVLLLTLLPVLLIIALIIKVGDGGPAFFKQIRIGRFGKPFMVYKFRTMSVANEQSNQLYTQTSDSRVTRIGYILRLSHFDEFPQLWNVIKGEMSIIGPRAEWIKLVERYKREFPLYHLRQIVKPGITGWAQVNYGYGASLEDTLEKLQYDLYYVKHYSPHMDASIVLKTIFTMLSGSGR
jgi:exopolysaccharide biosynthesis polyprenyl glycosylphosphotransferase